MTTTTRRRSRNLDLADYGRRLDDFVAELGAERFAGRSGRTDAMALAPIYERHADLFDRAAVDGLRRAAEGDGEAAHQARRLWSLAVEAYLDSSVVDLTERIAAAEATATIIWRGERIGYRAASARVAELSDRGERNILDAQLRIAVEAINPLRSERMEQRLATARELGFDDPVAMAEAVHGVDAMAVAAQMQRFLAASETEYFAALRRYLAEIDVEAGDGTAADLAHLRRGSGWDAWFEARRMVGVVSDTLRGMGIDVGAMRNVTLDWEYRSNKHPRAICIPVRIPGDVRLVLQPHGGLRDYAAALHELGHVAHYATTDASLPAGFRHAGDASVTEAYAFLFQYLTLEPAWLAQYLGMPDDEVTGFVDFAAFNKLYLIRRQAAKLLYELRLYRDPDPAVARANYAGMLGLLTGVRTPEANWLTDVDDDLYAARYLRAWMLEATIAARLRAEHGPAWWNEAGAGDRLRGLWSEGQRPSAEDVLAQLGYDRLDWRPILHHIRARLIGELSGYGGPNITTRAGTRKV